MVVGYHHFTKPPYKLAEEYMGFTGVCFSPYLWGYNSLSLINDRRVLPTERTNA